MVAKVGAGRGKDWEFGISSCTLLYAEWMKNKVLLYRRANYIQNPVINHNENYYEKEYIYICITESLCTEGSNNILNQLYSNKF